MPCAARAVWGSLLRHLLITVVAAVLLAVSAQAKSSKLLSSQLCQPSSVCVVNTQGTLSGSNSGLTLSGSIVTQIGNLQGSNLGSLTLTTGALLTGSTWQGGTFSASGSTFTITETSGPFQGTLFQGTFTSPINWTVQGLVQVMKNKKLVWVCKPNCTYTLSGNLTGTWEMGPTYNGATTQLTFTTKKPFSGSIALSQGNTFVVTAEPASLALMGTGLLGVGFIARRKAKGARPGRSS